MPSLRRAQAAAFAVAWVFGCSYGWDDYRAEPTGPSASSAGPGGASSGTGATANGGAGGTMGPGGDGQGGGGGISPWYDQGLTRRRPLTVAPTARGEALTDFPMLVRLDSSRIDYAAAQPDGSDLRFVADDHATLLAHEIEAWDPAGESIVWVRLPSFGPSRISFWLYYGGAPTSAPPDPTATWSSSFLAVWHMGADLLDSSGNGHDGTASGQVVPAAGKVGGARLFDGTDAYVGVPATAAFDTVFVAGGSISLWMNATSSGEMQRARILDRSADTTFGNGWALYMTDYLTPASVGFAYDLTVNDGRWTTPNASVVYGQWQHVAATFAESSTAPLIYLDGAQQTLVVAGAPAGDPPPVTSVPARIGNRSGAVDRDFAGAIDELRVAATIRSDAWVAAEVASAQDALIAFGSEESH